MAATTRFPYQATTTNRPKDLQPKSVGLGPEYPPTSVAAV